LVLGQHRFEIAGEEVFDRDCALARARAFGSDHRDLGGERNENGRQVHVRIAVREIAADGRHVAHADVGEAPHGARDHRSGARHFRRTLDHRERRHGADGERAVLSRRYARISCGELAQAHQSRGTKYARLHHQHQRGAAGDRPHGGILGVEQCDGFIQRSGLNEFERGHVVVSDVDLESANAARMRSAKSRSISLALARSTGWPRLPSLPVSAASISYLTLVPPSSSISLVSERAVSRPTIPSGVPSILASISRGGSARATSTATLNLNLRYATLVSNTAV